MQVGLLGGLGGITGHPTFAEQVVSARRTKPVNPNRLVPPHPAAWATFNAWAAFNAAAAHAIEGKIKPGLPRHSRVLLLSLATALPSSFGRGAAGDAEGGRLVCFASLFSQARLPNLVCIWLRRCDNRAKPRCSRHSGVPAPPGLQGWFCEGLLFLGEALPRAGVWQHVSRWIPSPTDTYILLRSTTWRWALGARFALHGEAGLCEQMSFASIFQQQIKIYLSLFFFSLLPK